MIALLLLPLLLSGTSSQALPSALPDDAIAITATVFGNWAFEPSINFIGFNRCGGFLLTPRHVLTVASCFEHGLSDMPDGPASYIVLPTGPRAGERLHARRVFLHAAYGGRYSRPPYDEFNIAVVELRKAIPADSHVPLPPLLATKSKHFARRGSPVFSGAPTETPEGEVPRGFVQWILEKRSHRTCWDAGAETFELFGSTQERARRLLFCAGVPASSTEEPKLQMGAAVYRRTWDGKLRVLGLVGKQSARLTKEEPEHFVKITGLWRDVRHVVRRGNSTNWITI